MSSTEEKLDGGLSAAYRTWAEEPDLSPDAGISVSLSFQGDLAAIEALGFETHSVGGNQALGIVRFKDIPTLAAHPGVLWMAAGRPRKKHLNTAVRDVKARAAAAITGPPVDGVWHAVVATGVLTHVPKATGKGVVVAIMDTGIDVTHPMFLSQLTPAKKTRILKIWDQGLTPAAIGDCPDVTLLESTKTYGVEFDSGDIETHLNGGATIAHKDCDGHGTHVAGIAAGGTLFPPGDGDASKVGVAPEADIIVVKYLDNPEKIFYRKPDASADSEVGEAARYRDGVLWCLRTAARMLPNPKPVVINMSFGDGAMPGDGLDDDAHWTDEVMDPAHAPGNKNFPKGAIIVKSSGNDGDADDRLVARIEVPATGEVIVPLELVDERMHADTDWKQCAQRLHKPDVGVHFWYRRAAAPLSVRFALKLPHGDSFGAEVMVGGKLEAGFRPMAGPPPSDIGIPFGPAVHRYTIEHENNPAVPHPAGGTVQRQHVHFFVDPKVTGGTVTYHPGIYEMRIRAPQDTRIFALCDEEFWNGERVAFKIGDSLQDGTHTDPSEITVLEEFSAADPLGRHVITVAAYDDTNGSAAHPRHHHLATFSSRGPLRDYSDPAAPKPVIPKPDIAAPGVRIDSAEGKDTEEGVTGVHLPWWDDGVRFVEHSGTSMAAPMVTGVVALMLEKNPNLNTTDVRTHLSFAPRAAVAPSLPPASTNAYGAGMVDALTSHNHTP